MTESHKTGKLASLLLSPKPTNWDVIKKMLINRYNLKTANVETIAKCMAVEMGFADPTILASQKQVGAPNKWNISMDGLTLYLRFKLAIIQNPKLKKSAIAAEIKQKYGYKISDKRLQNLYTTLHRDRFIQNILEIVHYDDMPQKDQIKFLTLYATNG